MILPNVNTRDPDQLSYVLRLIDEKLSELAGIHGQANFRSAPYSQADAITGPEVPRYDQFTGGFVPTTRVLTAGSGLLGGGDLSADRTFSADYTAVTPTSRTLTAGAGLSGGGDLTANRSFAVDFTAVVSTARNLIAGDGLTGGGTLAADRTFNVGAGNGISVAADSVAVNLAYSFTWTGSHQFSTLPVVFGDGTAYLTSLGACTISGPAAPAVVHRVGHGLAVGQEVGFSNDTPTPLHPDGAYDGLRTTYFIIAAGYGADDFEIALTPGGAALNTTGAGTAPTLYKITRCSNTWHSDADGTVSWQKDRLYGIWSLRIARDTDDNFSYPNYEPRFLVNSTQTADYECPVGFSVWINSAANCSELYGFWGGVHNARSVTIGTAIALLGYNLVADATTVIGLQGVGAEGIGSAGLAVGGDFRSAYGVATSLTTAIGVNINDCGSTGGALPVNDYGLKIEAITAGSSTNYGIYSAGGVCYFEGDTVIGNPTALAAQFSVDNDSDKIVCILQGHSTQTTHLFVCETSAGTDVFTVDNSGNTVISGDTYWNVSGAGLPYGSCYGNEIAWTQVAAQNTWYEISDADMSDGQLNLVAHDGSGKLTVTYAGRYLINYSCTFEVNSAAKHMNLAISISGTEQAPGQSHLETLAANQEHAISGQAILSLAASATIEVSIETTDAGNPTITVDDLNITAVMVGG